MNLHRSTGQADWEQISPAARTRIQKLAAQSGGILTPPNGITVIGLALVMGGLAAILQTYYWLGLILLAAGRLLDIADGLVAEATDTKSPVGEAFDALADKVGTLLTVIVLVAGKVASWWLIAALVVPQIAIPLLILYKRYRHKKVHPSRAGKISMALAWIGIVGLLISKAANQPTALVLVTDGIVLGSLLLGLYALWQYATGRG